MTEKPTGTLAAALAAFQAELPPVGKAETAEVEGTTKSGKPFKYKYSYADLAAVSKVVLPLLGQHGLAWITKPTLREDGKFVLAYKLAHVSGDEEAGEYPLSGGTAQEIGSAITYARRYALCSVTGVAPESDDDDGSAANHRSVQEDWDAATPATAGQARVFDDLMRQLSEATSVEQIKKDIAKSVHMAAASRAINKVQFDKLDVYAGARMAELEQVAS